MFTGTPHFGAELGRLVSLGTQGGQLAIGSQFVFDLATWNQNTDDLRGIDSIAVIGDGGLLGTGDGVVSLSSASLRFAGAAPERTRVVPYCHQYLAQAFCKSGTLNLVEVNGAQHLTGRIVRSFLADGTEWRSLGTSASVHPGLAQRGGTFVAVADRQDAYYSPTQLAVYYQPSEATTPTKLSEGGGAQFSPVQFLESVAARTYSAFFYFPATRTQAPFELTVSPGGAYPVRFKYPPMIASVQPSDSVGTSLTLTPGRWVIIRGAFWDSASVPTQVLLNNQAVATRAITQRSVEFFLPAESDGPARLSVRNSLGQHTVTIMTDRAATTPPVQQNQPVISALLNGASFLQTIASSSWMTITGTNLSRTTRTWRADEIVQGRILPTSLDGVRVNINGSPAAVYYVSPTQLNVLAPVDASVGNVAVEVVTGDGIARGTVAKRAYAPGIFMQSAEDRRFVVAYHVDGTLVGRRGLYPSLETRPLRAGQPISLYLTGMGSRTESPLASNLVLPSPTRLLDAVTATIGGQNAVVLWAGAISSGVYQVNLVPPNLPNGDHAIAIEISGARSQVFAMISAGQ